MSDQSEIWAKGDAAIDAHNLLWKQYTIYVDLFKFYLDMALKATIWFFTLTGAILTYYFTRANAPVGPLRLKFALVLPMVLGVGLGVVFLWGSLQANDMRNKLTYIRNELKLPGMPHVHVLINFLVFAGFLLMAVSISIYWFEYRT